MEYKVLGFQDAMKVAELLVDSSLDWLFLDETLSTDEIMYLIQDGLGDEKYGTFLFLLLGNQETGDGEDVIASSIATLQASKIRNLLTFYQSQREK